MRSHKMVRPTSVALALLASTLAGFAGLTTSSYSFGPDAWAGSPYLANTVAPNANSTVSNGGGTNSAVAVTFTTGAAGFQLDKFALVVAGGPSQGLLNLYPSPVGGGEGDGFVNTSFSTSLLNGGVSIPFTFFGTGDEVVMEFDLTGLDEVTLAPNTKYALDFKADLSGTGYNFFIRRGGAFYTGGGNIYATATADTAAGQRFDVAGGRRDAPLALYAVPEPTSLALLGVSGLMVINHLRRRSSR